MKSGWPRSIAFSCRLTVATGSNLVSTAATWYPRLPRIEVVRQEDKVASTINFRVCGSIHPATLDHHDEQHTAEVQDEVSRSFLPSANQPQ